jgi:4-amino-4-deoxy-L-arabinose transferase-like glycosyltransferase
VGVRLAFLAIVEPPILEISDAGYYHLLANDLAEGEGYLRPYELLFHGDRTPTAEFPPLLPLILAGPSLVGIDTIYGHRVVLAILAAGTIWLIGSLGRRLGGPVAGLVAAAVAALHPMLIGADVSLMTEGVGALLTVAVLRAALLLLDDPRPRHAALLGALGGAAALLRGEGALLLAGVVVVVGVALLRRHQRSPLRLGAAVALTAVVVVLPWLVRNARVFDGFVMSNNLGSVLAGSYCDETFDGPWVGSWRLNDTCFSGYGFDRGLNEAEGAAEIRHDAIDYALDHAGELPRVAAIRVARLFGVWDLDQQVTLASFEARDPSAERAGAYLTWVLMPIAVAGAVVVARRRGTATVAVLAVPIVTAVATAAVTYGNQRFRVGADVVFVVLAAVAVGAAVEALSARRGSGEARHLASATSAASPPG